MCPDGHIHAVHLARPASMAWQHGLSRREARRRIRHAHLSITNHRTINRSLRCAALILINRCTRIPSGRPLALIKRIVGNWGFLMCVHALSYQTLRHGTWIRCETGRIDLMAGSSVASSTKVSRQHRPCVSRTTRSPTAPSWGTTRYTTSQPALHVAVAPVALAT